MARAEAVIAAARGWIGTPYLHQASLKGVGTDWAWCAACGAR